MIVMTQTYVRSRRPVPSVMIDRDDSASGPGVEDETGSFVSFFFFFNLYLFH